MPSERGEDLEGSKRVAIGKHIVVREHDLPLPEPEDGPGDSEQGVALKLARELCNSDDWHDGEFINMSTGLGVSPEFHQMVTLAARGALTVRDMAGDLLSCRPAVRRIRPAAMNVIHLPSVAAQRWSHE
jgi:hypothetical protein